MPPTAISGKHTRAVARARRRRLRSAFPAVVQVVFLWNVQRHIEEIADMNIRRYVVRHLEGDIGFERITNCADGEIVEASSLVDAMELSATCDQVDGRDGWSYEMSSSGKCLRLVGPHDNMRYSDYWEVEEVSEQ